MSTTRKIDLIIVGAQKCGTTTLMELLRRHPDVRSHEQAEFSYFVNDSEYENGFDRAWLKYFGADRQPDERVLAKHVLIMQSKSAIKRLFAHNPNALAIVVLRNPVDRAYSAYWYARRKGWEPLLSFEEALAAENGRLAEGWHKWRRNSYRTAGEYSRQIQDLIDVFSRERILIFTLDELRQDSVQLCRSICRGIGLDDTPDLGTDRSIKNSASRARSVHIARITQKLASSRHPLREFARRVVPANWSNWVRKKIDHFNEVRFEPPPMQPDTRQDLVRHYRPWNERLAAIIDRDLDHWNC